MLGHYENISGWGRTPQYQSKIFRPTSSAELRSVVDSIAANNENVIGRGLGRSYGDAAFLAGENVIDLNFLNRILDVNYDSGEILVESGVSLDSLMRIFVPKGYFVPVTPGTRYVTVGGALASDVHGKNHHIDGSISDHISSFTLITENGQTTVDKELNQEYFNATRGGMGLTGIIETVKLKLVPIETSYVNVHTTRVQNLEALIKTMKDTDDNYKYSVAWIDCLSKGQFLGRSVLTQANDALLGDLDRSKIENARHFNTKSGLSIPFEFPISPLNKATIKAFNTMWYFKTKKGETDSVEHFASFFHPLDGIGEWNRIYGKTGFTQYQFVVPDNKEAELIEIVELLAKKEVSSFLAVLKRFGPKNGGYLSFPTKGWTLALDIAIQAGLSEVLDQLDDLVVNANGRVYFAKDARVSPNHIHKMYPDIDKWRKVRNKLDPNRIFTSNLALRTKLI